MAEHEPDEPVDLPEATVTLERHFRLAGGGQPAGAAGGAAARAGALMRFSRPSTPLSGRRVRASSARTPRWSLATST